MEKKIGYNFTEGSIVRLLIVFMLPFLAANLLTDLYNMVDMIIIGRFVGNDGIVSVTMGGKIMNMCNNISISLSAGGQVLIAQQIGAKKPKQEMNRSAGTLFSSLILIAIVFLLAGIGFSDTFLKLINTPPESYAAAVRYFRITCLGFPMVFGYSAVSAVLRGMGDSKRPLLFISLATVTNLVLDLIFVGSLRWGVTGTAVATVIGQTVAFSFSVVYLYRKRHQFVFDFRMHSFVIDRQKLAVMMKIGVPMAAQTVMINGTQLVMMSFVNAYGLVSSVVYSISDRIVTLCNVVNNSINSAGGSIVAQNIGAQEYGRVKKTVYTSLKITVGVALILGILSLSFSRGIFGIFSVDQEVLNYAPIIMKIAVLCYILAAVMGSYNIITSGTGNATLAFLAGFLDGVVFRFGFSFLFGYHFDMGVVGFFLGNTLARLGPLLVHTIYYYSGKWKSRRLID